MSKGVRISFLLVMVVSLSHFVQKPFRDYAITIIGLDKLNWLLTGVFLVSILIVLLFYFFRNELRTWMPRILLINGVLLFTQFVLLQQTKEYLMIYCVLTGAINLSLMSVTTGLAIQSLSMEHKEMKASGIYMGQAIAAIIGPLFCMFMSATQTSWVLVSASVLSFLGAFLFNFIPGKSSLKNDEVQKVLLADSSFYQATVQTFFYTLVSILFYYLLLHAISVQFEGEVRMTAFAFVELGSGILGLAAFWLMQNLVSSKKSGRWMLPFFSLVILIGVICSPILSLSIALLIFFKVIKNGVRSVERDISLLAIAPASFVPTKNLLDTVIYRSGDMAGGWIIHGLKGSVNSILVVSGIIALLWLLHSIRITHSKFIN
jgi:hypothetical protein